MNGFGMLLTGGILISLCVVKFSEGGWATMLVTGLLIAAAFWVKRHYKQTQSQLQRLNELVAAASIDPDNATDRRSRSRHAIRTRAPPCFWSTVSTAWACTRCWRWSGCSRRFIKISSFCRWACWMPAISRARREVENLREHSRREVERYVGLHAPAGFLRRGALRLGTDVADEAAKLCEEVAQRFPQAQFFAGQLVFKDESFLTRWLHNHTVFELQRRLYQNGWPMLILPIQV